MAGTCHPMKRRVAFELDHTWKEASLVAQRTPEGFGSCRRDDDEVGGDEERAPSRSARPRTERGVEPRARGGIWELGAV